MAVPGKVRTKQSRDRHRRGDVSVRLDIPHDVVCRLIDHGLLCEADAEDAAKIADALVAAARAGIRAYEMTATAQKV